MLRLNRSRVVGVVCLVLFIYFLVFTDSGSSGRDFRAITEAGLAKKKHTQHDLPLRGDLSDADLTKKTNDELQGILSSKDKDNLSTDDAKSSKGKESKEFENHAPAKADLEKEDICDCTCWCRCCC